MNKTTIEINAEENYEILSDNYRHLVIMLSKFMITAMLSGATFQTG